MPNYTYDDFISYLPSAGLTESDFSAQDLALAKSNPTAGVQLMEAKSDWKNAKTDDERALANARANQVRSQYGGYDGGIDGANGNVSLTPDDMPGYQSTPSQTSFTPAQQSYGQAPVYSFNQQAPTYQAPAPYTNQYQGQQQQLLGDMMNYPQFQSQPYQNQYSEQQQQLLNDMLNYEKFSFDPETSPLYSSYKKQYSREGNRAMQDTLGSMAAATGGMPSTAAMSAASQANDYYMAQLGDRLPQIYQQEYNKYLQDFGMIGQKLGQVNDMEGVDYSRYWDGKNFDYGKYLDDYSRMQSNLGAVNTLAQQDRGIYESDRNYGLDVYGMQRGDFESDRNYGLDLYGQQRSDYNADRNYDYGRQLDELERQRKAEQTQYDRSRDTKSDERQAMLDEQALSEYERKQRLDTDSRMMDLWKAQGTASPEVAAHFGIPVGTYYGGEETRLALEQSQANIANTRADTAYRNRSGYDTGSKGATSADIDAAYNRVKSGSYEGSDISLLKANGFSDAQINALIYSEDDYAIEDEETPADESWRDKYDSDSLAKLKIDNLTEEKVQQILDSPKYVSWMKNGKIYFERR